MSSHFTRVDRLATRWPASIRHRAIAAGLAFGVVGLLVAVVVAGGWVLAGGGSVRSDPLGALGPVVGLALAAGLGAAAVGAPLWWKLVEVPDEPTTLRGGLVGAAVGVLAHPLMWLLFGLAWQAVDPMWTGRAGTVGGIVRDLFYGYVVVTVVSVVAGGLVTVPVATVAGVALAHLRTKAPWADRRSAERRIQDL